MSFNNCSKFTISGGTFTKANHVSNYHIVHRNVVNVAQREEERTRWDDYNHVKIGDICIESNVVTLSAGRDYYNEERRKRYYELFGQDILDARRNFSIARLRGEDREDKFLCVIYEGSEAFKAFKQDFDEFSQIKHRNVAQIFGFNDNKSGILALLFHDALIPLKRFLYGNEGQILLLLWSYFDYQFSRMRMEISAWKLSIAESWVDPRTGALLKGPCIEQSPYPGRSLFGIINSAMPNIHLTYLSITTLTDTNVVLEYLTNMFTIQNVLQTIHWYPQPFEEHLANEHIAPVLSFMPGTIYNTHSHHIIARWPGVRERLQYTISLCTIPALDDAEKSQVIMEDGLVRFTVTPTKMNKLQKIYLGYELPWENHNNLKISWLAQAHYVFGQLQIHADEWKDYAILCGFDIELTCSSLHKELNVPPEVYLFILPVPCPSDDEGIWRSWVEGERYFWSFDPFGREKASDLVLASSGIPSFTSMVFPLGYTWTPSDYDIMQKLHVTKGFNPTTTDFAVAAGYPILKIIHDNDQFEDFEESSFDMSTPRVRRRDTVKHRSQASIFWSNHRSRTKNLETADAKIMKSLRRVQTSSKQ